MFKHFPYISQFNSLEYREIVPFAIISIFIDEEDMAWIVEQLAKELFFEFKDYNSASSTKLYQDFIILFLFPLSQEGLNTMMNNRKYNTICSQENIGFSRFYEMIFLFSFPKTNYVQIFTLKCAPHSFYMITHSINWGVIKSILKDICIGISHSCLNRHCVLAFLLFCPFHLCLKGKKKKKKKKT